MKKIFPLSFYNQLFFNKEKLMFSYITPDTSQNKAPSLEKKTITQKKAQEANSKQIQNQLEKTIKAETIDETEFKKYLDNLQQEFDKLEKMTSVFLPQKKFLQLSKQLKNNQSELKKNSKDSNKLEEFYKTHEDEIKGIFIMLTREIAKYEPNSLNKPSIYNMTDEQREQYFEKTRIYHYLLSDFNSRNNERKIIPMKDDTQYGNFFPPENLQEQSYERALTEIQELQKHKDILQNNSMQTPFIYETLLQKHLTTLKHLSYILNMKLSSIQGLRIDFEDYDLRYAFELLLENSPEEILKLANQAQKPRPALSKIMKKLSELDYEKNIFDSWQKSDYQNFVNNFINETPKKSLIEFQ